MCLPGNLYILDITLFSTETSCHSRVQISTYHVRSLKTENKRRRGAPHNFDLKCRICKTQRPVNKCSVEPVKDLG